VMVELTTKDPFTGTETDGIVLEDVALFY